MTWGTKNMPPQKNLSRRSLSNWWDADADEDTDADEDADSSETICRPPPYVGGRHKKLSSRGFQTKKGGLGNIVFFKTCLVNLISTLVLLYCTNYVSKKGVLVNNTDHTFTASTQV